MAKPLRIIIKLGTGLVVDAQGQPQQSRLKAIAEQMALLVQKNCEVVLVSSGAIGLGRSKLNDFSAHKTLEQKQALAAIGQPLLMRYYAEFFETHNQAVAQVLVTHNELSERTTYLNLKNSIHELLKLNVIPIINENDCVSTQEIDETKGRSFGDNDVLSSLVASKLDADLLIILTNVKGLYEQDPQTHPEAEIILDINHFQDYPSTLSNNKSTLGRGGVSTKIQAAKIASLCGVKTIIASGYENQILQNIIENKNPTWTTIHPFKKLPNKKKWLGFSKSTSGTVVVNEGAVFAIENSFASLLPVGVLKVHGQFNSGSLISIANEKGVEIARGLCDISSSEINDFLKNNLQTNKKPTKAFVHRDNMIVFKELIYGT